MMHKQGLIQSKIYLYDIWNDCISERERAGLALSKVLNSITTFLKLILPPFHKD